MKYTKAKLPNICTIKTGKHDANHANKEGKYRFYTCSNQYSKCDTYSFTGESVIVPGNGDIGLVFYYDGEFDAYQRTYVLNDIKILPKYLFYHMQLYWRNFNDQKKFGSTVKYVRMSNFTNYEISYPSIEKQQCIVAKIEELFSELDNAVETLNATKTQLEVYRQAVLSDMLCKNTTNSTLEECLISLQNGIAKRSGIYGTPVKVLRLSNITNDSVIADSEMRSINLTTTEQQKYLLDEEDGIFVRVNGSTNRVGRLILINKDKEYAYCDHLIRCKFDTGVVIPKFIKLCLDTQHSRNYMMNNLVSSAGQNTISQTTIRNLPLWIPDLIDQEQIIYEIESRLSVYESIEKTIINTLQQATAMRQSILKQAFEGRLL
ncbi:restriction endonuclease subunit S [Parvimonas sp. G1641]|uniref:restriction endonuclease subunit S n=1 Tax=Parvimonas sp. G1641 TaxID=3388846 RepID=UPI003980FB2F